MIQLSSVEGGGEWWVVVVGGAADRAGWGTAAVATVIVYSYL